MRQVQNETGAVTDFISAQELDQAVEIFLKFPSQPAKPSGVCYGVDHQHLGYLWFKTKFMSKLEDYFQRRLNLVFGMYADIDEPFGTHSDIRPVPGQVFASCLIPVSVDHDVSACGKACTDIYNEIDTGQAVPGNPTLKQRHIWQRGSLIWWDTKLYHSSGSFNNFTSKQSIVIHTYV